MTFLERFTVQSRLIAVVLIFLGLLMLGGGLGYRIMVAGADQSRMLVDDHIRPSGLLNEIRSLQADSRTQLLLALQHDPVSPFVSMHEHALDMHLETVNSNILKIDGLIKKYRDRKIEDEREIALLTVFDETRARYLREGVQPTVELLKAGEYLKANASILKQVNPLFKASADAGAAIGEHILKAAEEEESLFLAEQKRVLFGFGSVVSLLVLVAIAISWATLRSVVLPLRRIIDQFKVIAQGNLQQSIPVHGNNEITEVQKSLNQVQDEMRTMVRQILDAAHQISLGGRALGEEVHIVVKNSQDQSGGVMEVSAAMEEVTVSVGEVAQHTELAAAAAKDASRVVDVGAQAVEAEVRNTQQVVEAVQNSTERMEQLRDGIGRIGSVTQVIREVADQTNPLALNAAIEAARAGEQGRGFAVVADEVRKLAERTSASTADISRLIGEIQLSASHVVSAMEDARGKVEGAQNSARDSGNSLKDMRRATDQVTELTEQIAHATAEQSSAAMSVTQSMDRIASLISDTHSRVGRVETVSAQLIETADRLQTAVKVFRV